MTPRRVAVFTSSRADLGPLGPVIAALDAHPEVDLTVLATGTHLLEEFGGRLEDIDLSASSRLVCLDADLQGTAAADLGTSFGAIGAGVSRTLNETSTEVLLLLGDRWELLAAAGAALIHGVAIAHVHGGESTEGAIDERIRHGVTKLADLHLCATTDSARRIRQLGEEPRRIVVTGAPGLDRLADVKALSDDELELLLGQPVARPFGMVVYHPSTVDRSTVGARARAVYDAAAATLGTVLVLHPGADPGADGVIAEIDGATTRHSNMVSIRNLGPDYLRVLRTVELLVGNSSSGIIEAASFQLPVVDIGDRQRGRLRPRNVIHAEEEEGSIRGAIQTALEPAMKERLEGLLNPYGDGRAAPRIVEAVLGAPYHDFARKPLVEVGFSPVLSEMTVLPTATLRDALSAINRGRCQLALVAENGRLLGLLSDGDVRRALLAGAALEDAVVSCMNATPLVASPADDLPSVAAMMQREGISQIPIVDIEGRIAGLHVMRSIMEHVFYEEGFALRESLGARDRR